MSELPRSTGKCFKEPVAGAKQLNQDNLSGFTEDTFHPEGKVNVVPTVVSWKLTSKDDTVAVTSTRQKKKSAGSVGLWFQ